MQCPGSQQQLVPATAPRGHVVPGCSTCSRDYGNHRCKSAFVLPESRWPRSIPVPCGGTSQSRTPFPRAVTCGHVSCTGRGDGFPPSPVSQGLLPPYHVGAAPGDRAVNRGLPPPASLPRQCPLVPTGPERVISAPKVPKPQVGEVERFRMSSDGKFPTCCTLEAVLTERTASPATEMAREVTGTGPLQGRTLPGQGWGARR